MFEQLLHDISNGLPSTPNSATFVPKKIKQLIVIEGPTASGKTALSVQLAKSLSSPVISADSRQFYREMSIGTAKPLPAEMEGVPHYFIDTHSIHQEISAARFAEEALVKLDELFKQSDHVVMTGGSGLFIDAVCIGLDPIPTSESVKEALIDQYKQEGLDNLLKELKTGDPAFYEEVDRNNPARVIRAVEVLRITGRSYSSQRENKQAERLFVCKRYVINHPREVLYNRINQRVDQMINAGLLDEVRKLYPLRHLRALQTVGYSELFDHLDGNISLSDSVEKIKQNTRRYAKRQLTWFRRHPDAHWLLANDQDGMLAEILQDLSTQLKSNDS